MIALYVRIEGFSATAPVFVAEARLGPGGATFEEREKLDAWVRALEHPAATLRIRDAIRAEAKSKGLALPPNY